MDLVYYNSSVNIDLFKRVEIEINTNCNRRCSYCPNSIIDPIEPPQLMNEELYKKIINELKELSFLGRLSFNFYNEPLLHPNIIWIIKYAATNLPNCEKVIYTNGDKLTELLYYKLIKAGLNHLAISNHAKRVFPNRPYQTVLENFHINNKGGLLGKMKSLDLSCFAPTYRLVIAFNGDVLLCYEDAKRLNVFGNVLNSNLIEIWESKKFREAREDLARGHRYLYKPCKYCDNQSHINQDQIYVNHLYI